MTVKQNIEQNGCLFGPESGGGARWADDSVFVSEKKINRSSGLLRGLLEGNKSSIIAQQIQVSVGNEKRGDMEEILSGLRPGDKVIVAGASQLQDQSPIKVVTTKGCE